MRRYPRGNVDVTRVFGGVQVAASDGRGWALKTRLFDAFDLTILWNKTGNQATVTAVITDATLRALPEILDPSQDGYHDTAATPAGAGDPAPATVGDLAQPPIGG